MFYITTYNNKYVYILVHSRIAPKRFEQRPRLRGRGPNSEGNGEGF